VLAGDRAAAAVGVEEARAEGALALAAHVAREDERAFVGVDRRERRVVELFGTRSSSCWISKRSCAARAGSRSLLPCTMFGFQPCASPHGSQR
jgi:hypothetical protein